MDYNYINDLPAYVLGLSLIGLYAITTKSIISHIFQRSKDNDKKENKRLPPSALEQIFRDKTFS